MIASHGYVIGPAGLEPPAEARNKRKATVKNTKNRPIRCGVTEGTIPELCNALCVLEGWEIGG